MTYQTTSVAMQFARERMGPEIAAARQRAEFARPRRSIRRSIGHRIIRFGHRVAAEAPYELARSH